jgi:phosphohistidine phosphatase SixA
MRSRALGIALRAGALSLVLLAPTAALAQQVAAPAPRGADLLAALRAGGHILYFRHADTDHGQTDQRMTAVGDCTTQRNLTDRGRDHARALGEAIRALDIPIGVVLASPVETAELAFGTARKSPAVRESGPLPAGSPERFPALRALLSAPVAPGPNTVVVGHAYPYHTLVGGQYLREGEADILRPRGADFQVVARVSLEQWRDLAALPTGR